MKGENQRAHIDFKRQPHKMVGHTQIIHKSIDLLITILQLLRVLTGKKPPQLKHEN